jgi:hypothetical protein
LIVVVGGKGPAAVTLQACCQHIVGKMREKCGQSVGTFGLERVLFGSRKTYLCTIFFPLNIKCLNLSMPGVNLQAID